MWVSLSRTIEKNDDRKGRQGNKKTRKKRRQGTTREEDSVRRRRRGRRGDAGILERERLPYTLDLWRLLDYAGIRNFRGSSDSTGNHPWNWCCSATQSRPVRVQAARFFSLSSPFLFLSIERRRRNVFIILAVIWEQRTELERLSSFVCKYRIRLYRKRERRKKEREREIYNTSCKINIL